ncbi:2-dehydro-3-deoxy-D-gluconate 5-dehydrogenase KduD [Neiella marina]|uniref:2-dehydro-3-deoxy-D-gluconate 5-dehydrogenase KduD n=1 Tax=Neiella holothuriorum TaxID=2870530 RepID=A0ABS7EC91_9GAMM|nr:2-dehydro-3-deoxy-D-gluconate 5-dehydrogenase KduD [Neiella holothuriorum]MBW8189830.1 2-dehydro-3-deoxy-D-gluconate 5-dehydrogenase KduD [Neiella holothuriorum]
MSQQLFDLSGQVAMVTGCSTGLGQAMAIALAQAGCNIVAIGVSDPKETVTAIEQAGQRCHVIHADLAQVNDMAKLVSEAVEAFGQLNILVNNAGIIRRADAVDFTEADWDAVMDVNIKSLFLLSQAAAKHWIGQHSKGKIINIASMLSFQGGIRVPSYTASKSGVLGLTRALANEWAKYNINVNAIAPGYMATNNTAALQADVQRNQEILARIPAERWGQPADLAGPVVFLASAASDYMHGHTMAVDGGWLAR